MFPSEGWTAPEKVSFRYREGLPHPAHTVKDEVTTLRSWYTDNPGDVGCAVHELFHVVQGGYRRAPGWLTEGIADYVRWYLFEPGSHGCDMDVKSGSCRYNGSYRVSANFLNFVETRYPGTVRELNALCRQGKYDEKAYWLRRTGRSVLELEDEWKGRRGAAKAPAVRVMTYNIRYSAGDVKSKDNNWAAPIVFTGDHNCLEHEPPAKAVAQILTDALYLSETPSEGSWRTFNYWSWRENEMPIVEALKKPVGSRSVPGDNSGEKRIDYIYVSPGTRVLDYRTVPAPRPNTHLYPSDHFPSVATISFK